MTNVALPRTEMRSDDGQVAAWADAVAQTDPAGTAVHVLVRISVSGGHVPPGTIADLMGCALDTVRRAQPRKVTVVMPTGTTEALDVLREHCRSIVTHAAGSTCLVDVEL